MATATAHGTCLCGAVQFEVVGPSKWMAHCHCTRCQKAHGAAFATWVGVESGQAHIIDPQGALRWHVAPQGGQRGFCSQCGSPMFFKSERWPGELHIARALVAGPLDLEPQEHVYYESHVDWVVLCDALPRHAASD